jgi:hypothetical protein
VRSHPNLTGLRIDDDSPWKTGASTQVELPAGASVEIVAYFAPIEAYTAWCERFAFRVTFELDGSEQLSAVAETFVARVEPLRR